ncbi:IS3 family transposase [Streptomyces aureoversilis]|uniref:IS3 family transposase n=1 Tax=Streptomyces aureoversilis TaxID=67277 RepID=A0ABW0A812_9ACTN
MRNAELTEKVNEVHRHSRGTHGAPRVHAVLRREDVRGGRRRAARLIRAADLQGRHHRHRHRTTVPDAWAGVRPDLIGRDFAPGPGAPGARWCGDIAYIPTSEGWPCLATVIDIGTRRSSAGPRLITCGPNWSPTPSRPPVDSSAPRAR